MGDGPPLAMIHGWPQDHRAWRELVPLLADQYRLILPDLRGFGRSDATATDLRKDSLANDMIDVFDALGLDRLGLVGHDWGGFTGFLLALRCPERFAGYVACNITHPWLRISPRRALPFLYMPVVATPGLGPLLMQKTSMVSGLIRGGTAKGVRIADDAIQGFAEMIAEPARARASSRLYRSFLLQELPTLGQRFRGQRLQIPVRMVFGLQDPAIHHSLVRGLEKRAVAADYVWIDDAGHFVAEEQPAKVADAIRDFFSDKLQAPSDRATPGLP